MSQRLQDRLLFLRRALGLLGIFRFRLVVILPINDAALLLYLSDVQAADLQAGMFQHICPDLVIYNKANFLSDNYPCKDCNNDHSENSTNWVTPEDMHKAFLTLTIHYKTT